MKTSTRIATLFAATMAVGAALVPAMAQNQMTTAKDQPAQLQLQLDALNSMTDAQGPMAHDAPIRISQITQFISDQGLDDAWLNFTPTDKSASFNGLSFDQAFQTALAHQKLRGAPTPTTSNVEVLQREVDATQTLVSAQWDNVNKLHDQVAKLTSFLSSQDKLQAYQNWAITAAAKQVEQRAAEEKRKDAATAEHVAALRLKMDQEHHAHRSATSTSDPGDDDTDQGDYYDGSYWNGYADPYYDVWGHRRVRERRAVRDVRERHEHDDWHRRAGPPPHPAPSVRHPSRHGRRR